MTATMADVARAAGVSRATVSYVLNDAPGRSLTAQTRAAVLQAAQELDYRPNHLALSLKRGRSNTVLFPMPGVAMNHVLGALFTACTEALAPRGLSLVLDMSRHVDPEVQADAWAGLAPAAVLDLVLQHDDPALMTMRSRGIPVLSAALAGEKTWESSGDAFARVQRLAQVRHLVERGHRTLHWVLPRTLPTTVDPRTTDRLIEEIRDAAHASGAQLLCQQVDLEDVAMHVRGWTSMPDAVVAYNDTYALAVITALQDRGIRVPDEVAVIGADNEPMGTAVTPSLTTVAGDFTGFAQAIADAVEAVFAGGAVPTLPVPGVVVHRRASA